MVTGLLLCYPDQVKNDADLDRALALLATRGDIYVDHGLIHEGYTVGGFASFLLDRLDPSWKERIVKDPKATPIEMLLQHFKNEKLPAPAQVTQAELDAMREIARKTTDEGITLG